MRYFSLMCFLLLTFSSQTFAQDNVRYDLIHIRLDEDMTQHEFAMTYNICWEQVHFHLGHHEVYTIPANVDLYFPPDILPCYNEDGQRLIFYENGEPLIEPYYTGMRVYVTQEDETLESLTREVNVCLEDITYQNEHYMFMYVYSGLYEPLHHYDFEQGQELFIPEMPPCYDETGHKLHYLESGITLPMPDGTFYALANRANIAILDGLSRRINVCPEIILSVNQYKSLEDFQNIDGDFITLVIPDNLPECYVIHHVDMSRSDLSQQINVCEENIYHQSYYNEGTAIDYYVRIDAPSCYNDIGQPLNQADTSSTLNQILINYGDNLEIISRRYNVCAPDLVTVNYFDFPRGGQNYIIPQTPPCYDVDGNKLIFADDGTTSTLTDMSLFIVERDTPLQTIAWQQNVCPDVLIEANPHLETSEAQFIGGRVINAVVPVGSEVFIPDNAPSCYTVFQTPDEAELQRITDEYNVCMEELALWWLGYNTNRQYFVPHQRNACYDENGHRLSYTTEIVDGHPQHFITHLDLEVYIVPYTMSTYDLSRLLNICVNDLINQNPILGGRVPYTNLAIFIPETRPCYDQTTGQQLIYEDGEGNLLDSPMLSNELIYQVRQQDTWIRIGNMFNVCYNRVWNYNAGLLPNVWNVHRFDSPPRRIARPEGIFDAGVYVRIPTDRPPCFDYSEGRWIRYVCYDQPIDMSAENPDAVINPDGEHCYDIENPETVIWHEGDRYLYQYRTGLYRNDFMQWCFGVSEDDIIAEADNPIVYIIPYEELLVRNPTRPCYLREDDGLENIHRVQYGETLNQIAWRYGKLPSWIVNSNNLSNPDIIWDGQRLIIPEGIDLWHLLYAIPPVIGIAIFLSIIRYLFRRQQGLTGTKKKRKRKQA